MSIDIAAIVERARISAQQPARPDQAPGDDRLRLQRVAQEFESMLLLQMLKEMRSSGSWDTDGEEGTFGAETMLETLDVELARHLASVQGLGLSKQMLEQFDRANALPAPGQADGAPGASSPTQPVTAPVTTPAAAPATAPSTAPAAPETAHPPGPSKPPAVTSEFGWRQDPLTGQARFHRGVDLRAAYGQDVQATGYGTVVVSGEQGGYGNTVVIEHADGTRTRYAHLSATLVPQGARVAPGQLIGRVGSSGRSTGPHLHYEVIGADGRPVDPRSLGNIGT